MIDNLCWVITTGEAGMRSQALGLAEAVGLPIMEKQVVAHNKRRTLLGGLWPNARRLLDPAGNVLVPPWPRVVIACGSGSIAPSLLVKKLSGGWTYAVYVQNPQREIANFDMVVAMPHDGIEGPNVVEVGTTLHRVTPERLLEARGQWRQRLAPAGARILGVLIGGDVFIGRDKSAGYRLSESVTQRLIRLLKAAHAEEGLTAVITPSRRTSVTTKQAVAEAIAAEPFGMLWDEKGANPYFGILGLAERLIVTSETISMISEALATGRPVHVLPLEGYGERQDTFLTRLARDRLVSFIEGERLDWDFAGCPPINSTAEPAGRIRAMLEMNRAP